MQFFARVAALAAALGAIPAHTAPVPSSVAGQVVPGKWIIMLKPDADIATVQSHMLRVRDIHTRNLARRGLEETGGVEKEYGFGSFKGYSGEFDDATIEELKAMDEVVIVEEDSIMTTFALTTQSKPVQWGLPVLSSRTKGATDYVYDSSAGQGTFNYVVDTGIRITHQEFQGRAQWGFNAVNNGKDTDTAGHGTHVAGTIAGATYGVAKKATVIAVKVFEGDTGSTSTVLSGFNWAVRDIVSKNRTTTSLINMSLGGSGSATFDAAVKAAFEENVLSVVAAGNEAQDAKNVSPARAPETLCVANMQKDGARYVGSNFGSAVDVFAPGTDIVSAYYTADNAAISLTGTSMAAPHVAGLVSYLRGLEGPMGAAEAKERVLELATAGRVTDLKGSPNLLAYNGAQGA